MKNQIVLAVTMILLCYAALNLLYCADVPVAPQSTNEGAVYSRIQLPPLPLPPGAKRSMIAVHFPSTKITDPGPVSIHFIHADTDQIAQFYADLSNKEVMLSGRLDLLTSIACSVDNVSKAEAMALLEQALKNAGIRVVSVDADTVAFVTEKVKSDAK